MDELPELVFERILHYLSVEDRLKARAVSKGWRNKFDGYPMKTLCFSTNFIWGKSRLVNRAFVHYFISCTRFARFFDTFGPTILANLKHLRLCDLRLDRDTQMVLTRILESFRQLQELDIVQFNYSHGLKLDVELNLPMLHSILLVQVQGMRKLKLDAPRLKKLQIKYCSLDLVVDLVHAETVEKLRIGFVYTEMKSLKNLQHLYLANGSVFIDPTLLSSFEQLKELHLILPEQRSTISELFSQKERYGLADLKIYLRGLLLSGPDDPAIDALFDLSNAFRCLTENISRLPDEITCYQYLCYSSIEQLAPGLEMKILKRFINLKQFNVEEPVQNVQRFLNLLKKFDNIVELNFAYNERQPQELFDRLPEHSAVQSLAIHHEPSDFRFLFRLKHLVKLYLHFSIDVETVRKILDELPFISFITFFHSTYREWVKIESSSPKELSVSVGEGTPKFVYRNAPLHLII